MERYDPDQAVVSEEWMELDEDERHYFVQQYHRKKRLKMPNLRMHVAIHVVVENQVALGGKIPVEKTLTRLMREGLSRHDAVHAIGSVLSGRIFDLVKHGPRELDVNADYYGQLEKLTAQGWLNRFNEETGEE